MRDWRVSGGRDLMSVEFLDEKEVKDTEVFECVERINRFNQKYLSCIDYLMVGVGCLSFGIGCY